MKAAFIRHTGPPESIEYGDLPEPMPGSGQVLVRVRFVAVNPIDTYIRAGAVQMPLPLPFIVGCDLAGDVVAVGPDTNRCQVGDRVWGSNQGLMGRQGTFAEYAVVDETWLYHTPAEVEDKQVVAVALVGITAHLGLVRDAKLQAGETLFINGGSGGVGSSVIQMGKALGARVIATAGSQEKLELCRRLGADLAIDYHAADIADQVKQFAPQGVNVYWETQREPDFDRSVALLAPRGRMILMAGREARPVFPVGPFYVKGCSLHGFAMFNATPMEQDASAADINRWLMGGQLHGNIAREMPLSETAAAHRLQEDNTLRKSGTLSGKIVLQV